MKFFRQTKETKRKLSFFLALAMVISLLPVSPVAKATETRTVKVDCDVDGLTVESVKQLKNGSDTVTGSAVITLTAQKEITSINELTVSVTTGSAATSIPAPKASADVTVTGSALNGFTTTANKEISKNDNKKVLITLKDINEATSVVIGGSVEFKKDNTTETPKQPYKVTISSTGLAAGIKLDISGAVTSTGNHEIAADATNKKITLKILSSDSNKVITTLPDLKVDNVKKEWNNNSFTIEITKDTNISVTGGEVGTVAANNVSTKVTPAPDVKDKTGINEVSIESTDSSSDIGKNLAVGAFNSAKDKNNITVTKADGTVVTVDDTLRQQIITALSDSKTQMNTSLEVKVASGEAVTEAENKVTKSSVIHTDDITDENQKKALGNDMKEAAKNMLKDGVVLDITLTGSFTITGTTTKAAITISEVNDGIKVTMDVPKKYLDSNGKAKNGFYYALRVHGDEVSILPCTLENGKISFVSKKFSTYVISYIENSSNPENPENPGSSPKPGNNNGYIPGPGQSPAPSSSAAPSGAPSNAPSGVPGTNPTNAPGTNPSGAPGTNPTNAPGTDPTNTPSDPTKAPSDPTKAPGTSGNTVKVGKKATISGSQYKVTAVKGTRTVQFTKGKKNAKKIVIPSTVKVSGKKYKVTSIAKNAIKGNKKLTKLTIGANVKKIGANAFKGCSKLKSITVKTKKLTKSKVGNNAFKGINAKATIKVPKAKVKAYKKIVQAKGAGKSVKVKK